MVALLPVEGAVRDAFLAAGLGFLLGAAYRLLRFLLGKSRVICLVCDVLVLAAGAMLYRAAAVGAFAAGVMRWYTVLALGMGYVLCQKIFSALLSRAADRIHYLLSWPFRALWYYILCPVKSRIGERWKKDRLKRHEKQAARRKKDKRHLPSEQKVLYNSQ